MKKEETNRENPRVGELLGVWSDIHLGGGCVAPAQALGKNIPDRGSALCKCPKVGKAYECSRNHKIMCNWKM